MPAPPKDEYQPLNQTADDEPDVLSDGEDVAHILAEAGGSGGGRGRSGARRGSLSHRLANTKLNLDLSNIDHAFKSWTTSIANKLHTRRRRTRPSSQRVKPIFSSVFQPVPPDSTYAPTPPAGQLTKEEWERMVEDVKDAIDDGVHPKMIVKGSSGSYFARAKEGGEVKVVGVFKPKDEEPYGRLNPKWTKWAHRNFFWWIGFGRSCLIPNLSYISEAAASVLDDRLMLGIVPRTGLAKLSSPAFFYEWADRRAFYKKGKPLPEKIGSLQLFMHGYKDASVFLREHPFPGRSIMDTYGKDPNEKPRRRCNPLQWMCGRRSEEENDEEDDWQEQAGGEGERPFSWTPGLQQSFKEELEKLVILDYLMRNTDRGLDNFMIQYNDGRPKKEGVIKEPPSRNDPYVPMMSSTPTTATAASVPSTRANSPAIDARSRPNIKLAAIDNSLSFPHHHPRGWRSYTYGWLFLPVSLIGQPFSASTRRHFLPLLSSPQWWAETTAQLREVFEIDPDFNERMFARQMAIVKGQGWNIVQSLRHADEGPLELCRRVRVLVWDDEVEISDDALTDALLADANLPQPITSPSRPAPPTTRSTPYAQSVPLSHTGRSKSVDGGSRTPPARNVDRPVPLSRQLQTSYAGGIESASGVDVLRRMERLDAADRGLRALAAPPRKASSIPEAEEDDAVEGGQPSAGRHPASVPNGRGMLDTRLSLDSQRPSVMRGSMSNSEALLSPNEVTSPGHARWSSTGTGSGAGTEPSMEWLATYAENGESPSGSRMVVVERLESVKDPLPFFTSW